MTVRFPVDFPHKGPLIPKACLHHDATTVGANPNNIYSHSFYFSYDVAGIDQ